MSAQPRTQAFNESQLFIFDDVDLQWPWQQLLALLAAVVQRAR
jgi:hypothetical protein